MWVATHSQQKGIFIYLSIQGFGCAIKHQWSHALKIGLNTRLVVCDGVKSLSSSYLLYNDLTDPLHLQGNITWQVSEHQSWLNFNVLIRQKATKKYIQVILSLTHNMKTYFAKFSCREQFIGTIKIWFSTLLPISAPPKFVFVNNPKNITSCLIK